MTRKIVPTVIAAAIISAAGFASAYADDDKGPPQDALKLSEIIAKIEKRDGFAYIDEVDWEDSRRDGGHYEIKYVNKDRSKVEIDINPVSGEPK